MPIDVEDYIRKLLPTPTAEDYHYLDTHGYEPGAVFKKAMTLAEEVRVDCIPANSWFYSREPAFCVTGPSALVSWLEPLILQLNYQIQVATLALQDWGQLARRVGRVTCKAEKQLILETLAIVKMDAPDIQVCEKKYREDVLERAKNLVRIVKDPNRIFEVGMRAVSCPEQHMIALEMIKKAGIMRTSNVEAARQLNMIPVGTMGHEHVQRYGDDYEAFTAMRDRFPGFLFYLPDTFDTIGSGVPSALRVIMESPTRDAGIRFDSEKGIRGHYMFTVSRARELGLQPRLALESGWNDKLTKEFEDLREVIKWPANRQAYGYGDYLVRPKWLSIRRDDVSAVWKICKSGSRNTMKFGDEPGGGKESIPGVPIIFRPYTRSSTPGYVLQLGEDWRPSSEGEILTNRHSSNKLCPIHSTGAFKPGYSPKTQELVDNCRKQRNEILARVREKF
jgi:nicotinate phosphoribosyltransferase